MNRNHQLKNSSEVRGLRGLLKVITQEPAQPLATSNRSRATNIRILWEQQDVALSLVIPLDMEMFDIFVQRRRRERSPNRTTLDRHSSFTDLTQRSRAGNTSGSTWPDAMIAWKD